MTRRQQVFIWVMALIIIGACGFTAALTVQGTVVNLNATLTALFQQPTITSP